MPDLDYRLDESVKNLMILDKLSMSTASLKQ